MNTFPHHIIRTPWFYCLMIIAFIATFSALVIFIATPDYDTNSKQLGSYNYYQCKTNNLNSDKIFQTLNIMLEGSVEFSQALCENAKIAARYGTVETRWLRRKDGLATAYLSSDNIELVLFSRGYMIKALTTPKSNSFTHIADIQPTNSLHSYFWSKDSEFALNTNYLSGKKIGLLNDVNSQSRYQIPLTTLNKSQVPHESYEIKLYESDFELKEALTKGTVDVIATLSNTKLDGYTLYLGDIDTTGPYINTTLINTPIPCSVIKIIQQLIKDKSFSFLKSIQALNLSCSEQSGSDDEL